MRIAALAAPLALLLAGPDAQAGGHLEHGGYCAPDDAFSVRYDYVWKTDQRVDQGPRAAGGFPVFTRRTIHGYWTSRSIEWLQLPQPMADEQFDDAARTLVTGTLQRRFADSKVQIVDGYRRSYNGTPAWQFVAFGLIVKQPYAWEGVVIPYLGTWAW